MSHSAAAVASSARPYGPDKTLSFFFENYVDFRSSATREEYWWPFMILVLVHLTIGTTGALIIGTRFADDVVTGTYHPFGLSAVSSPIWMEGPGAVFAIAVAILLLIVATVTFPPMLAVSWRRLHDTGLPGSIVLLGCIPLLGWLVVLLLLARPSAPGKRRVKRYEPRHTAPCCVTAHTPNYQDLSLTA
jgi:uncharacterized membrane protein YhaH (DUF805 family)